MRDATRNALGHTEEWHRNNPCIDAWRVHHAVVVDHGPVPVAADVNGFREKKAAGGWQ